MDTNALISKLAIQLGREAQDVERCIASLADILVESLRNGDSVSLPGFGSFEPKMKMERLSVHPATGRKLLVPPKLTVGFKPSALLKQKVR